MIEVINFICIYLICGVAFAIVVYDYISVPVFDKAVNDAFKDSMNKVDASEEVRKQVLDLLPIIKMVALCGSLVLVWPLHLYNTIRNSLK